jgi:hypothetical protein
MMSRQRYVWQQIKNEENKVIDYSNWKIKKQRKKLATKLASLQHSGRCVHVMDNNMFNTVIQMLNSISDTDIQMAKNIIWHSKMSNEHMSIFINKYCSTLLISNE